MSLQPEKKRAPGRPRCSVTEQAIVDTTLHLLRTIPYRDITIDRIATTAKVGKQSIYRWWSSRADLVLDAYTHSLSRHSPALPSADAFADLEQDTRQFFALMRNEIVAKGVRSMIAEAQLDDAFREKFYDRIATLRCQRVREIIKHGQELGQIKPDIDIFAVSHIIIGAFWYRFLSGTPLPIDDAYARNVISLLRAGIATKSSGMIASYPITHERVVPQRVV